MNGKHLRSAHSLATTGNHLPLCTRILHHYMLLATGAVFVGISFRGTAAEPAAAVNTESNVEADWKSPSRVTIKCQDAAPDDVLDQLAKAADITLEAGNNMDWSPTRTVTLDVKDRPFWPVFLDACRQARIDFQTSPGSVNDRSGRRIRLTLGVESRLASMPTYEAEGCLLIFESADRNHSLQYGSSRSGGVIYSSGGGPIIMQGRGVNQSSVTFTLQATLLVDPKFRPTGSVRSSLTNIVDENGTSLLRPDNSASSPVYYGSQASGLFLRTTFNLNYPTNTGKKLAKMEGNLRIPTVLKEETWEINDVLNAKPETRIFDGRSITIQSVGQQTPSSSRGSSRGSIGYYEVRVTGQDLAESEAPGLRRGPNDLYQLAQSITLMTADGTQLNRSGGGSGPREATVRFSVSGASGRDNVPAKLVWKLATLTRELVVPFSVTDLPIP
jgi:hypothetical protein